MGHMASGALPGTEETDYPAWVLETIADRLRDCRKAAKANPGYPEGCHAGYRWKHRNRCSDDSGPELGVTDYGNAVDAFNDEHNRHVKETRRLHTDMPMLMWLDRVEAGRPVIDIPGFHTGGGSVEFRPSEEWQAEYLIEGMSDRPRQPAQG